MKRNTISKALFVTLVALSTAPIIAQEKKPGIDLSLMDKSVRPNDDFFNFVNGTWVKNTEIPADRTRWGSFDELRQKTDVDALNILEEASKNPAYKSNTDQGKAINLYRTIMDTVARNKAGIKPLKPYLDKINKVKSVADLQKLMLEMTPKGGIGFFGVGVGTDAKNSNRNVVNVGPGSLGLPDRDYYVSDDADSKEKRQKYVAFLVGLMITINPFFLSPVTCGTETTLFKISFRIPFLPYTASVGAPPGSGLSNKP